MNKVPGTLLIGFGLLLFSGAAIALWNLPFNARSVLEIPLYLIAGTVCIVAGIWLLILCH